MLFRILLLCFSVVAISAYFEELPPLTRSYVINGKVPYNGQFPWMVMLQLWSSKWSGVYYCSGAILNVNTILTAAHCLCSKPEWIEATAGLVSSWDGSSNEQKVLMKHFYMNPEFEHRGVCDWKTSKAMTYDLGIIKTKTYFKYNKYVKPVALNCQYPLRHGTTVWMMGFGMTGGSGKKNWGVLQFGKTKTNPCDWRSFRICAKDAKMTLDSGNYGDSGGPLVAWMRGKYYVVGVNSYGYGSSGHTNYFSSVYQYCYWLEPTLKWYG